MYKTSIPHLGRNGKRNMPCFDLPQLQSYKQWVVWRNEISNGKKKKPPYNPNTGNYASPTNPYTWGTYQDALSAYATDKYDGIGFVFSKHDPFCGIDLDTCRDPETGLILPWAVAIITTLSSYTEISPSGTGIHILTISQLPGPLHKTGPIELYDTERYFTLSGNHLTNTPTTIEDRQREVSALYEITFPTPPEKHSGGGVSAPPRHHDTTSRHEPVLSLDLDDSQLLTIARGGQNGTLFSRLYDDGAIPYSAQGKPDTSRADLALCGILAFYTRGDGVRVDRLFRRSRLMRPKWDEQRGKTTYGERTIALAIKNRPGDYNPRPKKIARHITHLLPVQASKHEETKAERAAALERMGKTIQQQAITHIEDPTHQTLIVLAPPGVGKSHKVAELGEQTTTYPEGEYNLAWIAERKQGVVDPLKHYQVIQRCTKKNCPYHSVHTTIAEKGYNTWSVHANHLQPCDYSLQFRKPGSKVYQLAHVRTRYPTAHQGIVIDELDLSKWLPEHEIGIYSLHSATVASPAGSTAEHLLTCLQGLITQAQRANQPFHGKALFDALDTLCQHRLESILTELRNTKAYENTHPWAPLDLDSPDAEEKALSLPLVVLPHILAALDAEFLHWRSGKAWNSRVRVGPGKHGWSFFITEPLAFHSDTSLPPRVVLDATADSELITLLFGNKVHIHKEDIPPTPGTRHIAVRTGKRYGKRSLCTTRKDGTQPDLLRAIAECKYFLAQVDPTSEACSSGKVGIITFAQCEDQLREALEIPEGKSGHFWAMRGSNSLEQCEVLLIVGTPTLRPSEIARLARALWKDDPTPIDETSQRDPQARTWHYSDRRMQKLSEYMTRAELTQCAHRVRPLKYHNRTVITFCLGEIDYLPATQTYTDLPQLTPAGEEVSLKRRQEEEERLASAYNTLQEAGTPITVRRLKETAHVATDTAASYLRKRTFPHFEEIQPEEVPTPPPLCSPSVPENPIEVSCRSLGNTDPPLETRQRGSPAVVCQHCGSRVWKQRLDAKWVCSCCFVGPPLRFREMLFC